MSNLDNYKIIDLTEKFKNALSNNFNPSELWFPCVNQELQEKKEITPNE